MESEKPLLEVDTNTFQVRCWICQSEDQLYEYSELLAEKLDKLVYIAISEDNSLSRRICESCIDRLNAAHEFVQQCLEAGQRLQEQISLFKLEKPDTGDNETIKHECEEETEQQDEEDGNSEYHEEPTLEESEQTEYIEAEDAGDEEESDQHNDSEQHNAEPRAVILEIFRRHDCETCGESFDKRSELHKHERGHGKDRFMCKECGRYFKRRCYLRAHMASHQDKPGYFCDLCSMGFKFRSSLDRHVKGVHLQEKRFSCKFCNKLFSQKKGMQAHETSHNERNVACALCPKLFKTETAMQKHLQTIHQVSVKPESETAEKGKLIASKPLPKSIICDICGRGFRTKALFMVHRPKHTKETPFACKLCPKKFGYLASLRQHMKIHNNLKPHKCDQCERSFRQRAHLTTHLSVHRGEKPFECVVCKKQFNRRANMILHMKVHGGNQEGSTKEVSLVS